MHMSPEKIELEIARLSDKLARHPDSRIFAPLGDAYRQAGRIAEAVEVCQQGLRHHPEYVAGQIVLGKCHFDRGELEAAASVFGQVVRADPAPDRAGGHWVRCAHRGDGEAPANGTSGAGGRTTGRRAARAREHARQGLSSASEFGLQSSGMTAPGPVDGSRGRGDCHRHAGGIYAEQGLNDRALAIYRPILLDDPGNAFIRDKAERFGAPSSGARPRRHRASSQLGGSLPGELRSREIGVTSDARKQVAARRRRSRRRRSKISSASPAPPVHPPARPPSRGLLMVDETDHDPDEVFGGAAVARHGAGAMSGEGGSWGSDAAAGVFSSPPGGAQSGEQREEEDLRKFQDWLKSLG